MGRVRQSSLDPVCVDFQEIQLVQNKLIRNLNGTTVKDKISTKSMLDKFGFLSVNQMNAQIKLLETWKAINVEGYPLAIMTQKVPVTGVSTRAAEKGRPVEIGKTTLTQNSSISDAIKVWNQAPISVTDATTLYLAKKNIREYAKSLPV